MIEESLKKTLTASLNGGNAHVTMMDAIAKVKPELRNKRPSKDIHSVWELFEHSRITQEDILRYTVNPDWVSPSWPEGHWPDQNKKVTEEMWDESIKKFNSDLEELIALVNDPKIELVSIIPHTKVHTYLREVILVIDHNSYHAGQIVETRKLLNDWNK